ncbi:hypothetical protein DR62_05880 [Burkholderia thailandensis]|nr:hypothetical protein DR62_05880 [Burkholderia thailandensis]AOI50976.1 hypothetical protein WI24_03605 [Burkholderia thailandensis]AOJ46285.1 hypothetical protein WJ27_15050 [Burkholderia thailandensis]AOJ50011.1 hypothetical protein AQ475_03615 [Burkholderia thailandensis]KVG06623.1 hypothetical protein WJ25_16570 [Burkholderia thailandensis]
MPPSSPFSLLERPRRRLLRAGRPRAAHPLRSSARRAAALAAAGTPGRSPTTPRRRPSGTQHRT